MASNLLKDVANLGGQEISLGREARLAFTYWFDFLENPLPRVVPLSPNRRPLVILTDGCCEEQEGHIQAGFGGIMFDPEDNGYEYFRGEVEGELLDVLTHQGEKEQIVGQAELIPCILSRRIWKSRLQHRCCLHYVDNEAARCSLIKGYSPGRDNAFLTHFFWAEEEKPMCFSWFDRVPSPSNGADPPSRGTAPPTLKVGLQEIGAQRVDMPAGIFKEWLREWYKYFEQP